VAGERGWFGKKLRWNVGWIGMEISCEMECETNWLVDTLRDDR
jgi:hypothetical protein